tara:strand:+ start:1797 stop:2099 length:303 start_codon:yes stop_codon:yes gene_type:complete
MKNTSQFARLATESNAQLLDLLDGRPVRMPDGRMESLVVRISPSNKYVIEVSNDWDANFRDAVWLFRISVDGVEMIEVISAENGNEAELAAALLPLLESI